MKLIITRPEDEAAHLAQALRGRGHSIFLSPLIKISPRADVVVPDLPYQAVCLTSGNAARNLPKGISPKISAFTVGPQSAAAALQAGFNHVEAKGGNVEGLVSHVKHCLRPARGPVLYVSGSETSGDLKGALQEAGFAVIKVVAYDAVPQALALTAAQVPDFDGVLLYSRRTARVWVAEMERLQLFPRLTHYCLSAQINEVLPEKWRRHTAQEPTESSLLELIDQAPKSS